MSAMMHEASPETEPAKPAAVLKASKPAAEAPAIQASQSLGVGPHQRQEGSTSTLLVNPPVAKLMSDAATSPFSDAVPFPKSPLAQAKDILSKVLY